MKESIRVIEMVLPFIHLNGTSRQVLLDERSLALEALRGAVEALEGMRPNGRDYYLEDGRMLKAEHQHLRRHDVLRLLIHEIEQEQRAIADL